MKKKLLIVDDETGIVDTMASYFSSQYEVLTAYGGKEALQKLAKQPDLILLDINMPDMDGLTLCQEIRKHITCPILFLTARVESADKIIGFQVGADDYIVKPFDLDELGARVAAHLRREQRHRNKTTVRFLVSWRLIIRPALLQWPKRLLLCQKGNLTLWSCFR